MSPEQIFVPEAPAIPGLRFRHFRGADDFPQMAAVLMVSEQADGNERVATSEGLAEAYQKLTNCDPAQDMICAEANGEMVGYVRGRWADEGQTGRIYGLNGFLIPAWRRKGIGRAMLAWVENHFRETAPAQTRFFHVTAAQTQIGLVRLLEQAGYQPIRHFHEMVRPTLEHLPNFPLPEGLDVRPAIPEHYRAIFESVDEASQDEWGYTEMEFDPWLKSFPHFQPELWQIAWDVATETVAGHVLTFMDREENVHFNRKRGYTEGIGVGRAWRRRGLARALIARSLLAQKAAGMTESALAADEESQSGVTRLYESCGFEIVKTDTFYRKPF